RPAGAAARPSLAARLDVGRGGERRSRRGGAARPENVVTKVHGDPPHEPELVPGAAGSARAPRGGPGRARLPRCLLRQDAWRPRRAWVTPSPACSFSRSAWTTKAISETSLATQCSFISRCSRRGMRVASCTQASVISVMFPPTVDNASSCGGEAGGVPRPDRAEEATIGGWGRDAGREPRVACREVATDARCVSLCLHAACRRKVQWLRALRPLGSWRGGRDPVGHPGKSLGEPDTWAAVSQGNTGSKETLVETYLRPAPPRAPRPACASRPPPHERRAPSPRPPPGDSTHAHEDLRLVRPESSRAAHVPTGKGYRGSEGRG